MQCKEVQRKYVSNESRPRLKYRDTNWIVTLGWLQERNEAEQSGHNRPGTESLWGTPKSPNNVTSTFYNTVYLLPKGLRFQHGGAKLASCPWHHLTSLHPWLVTTSCNQGSGVGGVWVDSDFSIRHRRSHCTIFYIALPSQESSFVPVEMVKFLLNFYCCVPRFPLIASCYKIVHSQTSFTLCKALRSCSQKFWKGRTFYFRLRNPGCNRFSV